MSGLFVCISADEYDITSQGESGDGYYDMAIIPKDKNKLAILLEFKAIKHKHHDQLTQSLLDKEATIALAQIDENHYTQKLEHLGYKRILKIEY